MSSRLCAIRLASSIRTGARRRSNRSLFVIATYAPTDCSSDSGKDTFYHDLNSLLRRTMSSDIVVVAGDMNAQVGRLMSSEESWRFVWFRFKAYR